MKYLIVSHDAGGAEIVSAWVRRHPEHSCEFILDGPAIDIFVRKIPGIKIKVPGFLSKTIEGVDFVLTGTSWASDLEKRAIALAKKKNICVASYLDHWINYLQRFKVLPDEIWVGDQEAFAIAKNVFEKSIIKLVPNLYFEDMRKEIGEFNMPISKNGSRKILYVSEPIKEHLTKDPDNKHLKGKDEYVLMEDFLKKLKQADNLEKIRIRLHPMEKQDKYSEIIRSFNDLPIEICPNTSLVDDCIWADWVVGCESMAMVIGLLVSKPVFTVLENRSKCSLPQKGIKSFCKEALLNGRLYV